MDPEDFWADEEQEDREDSGCEHRWVHVGSNEHGSYYRCPKCGLEEEV